MEVAPEHLSGEELIPTYWMKIPEVPQAVVICYYLFEDLGLSLVRKFRQHPSFVSCRAAAMIGGSHGGA